MSCPPQEHLVELAFACANGEQARGEIADAAGHVQACAQCNQRFKEYTGVISGLRGVLEPRGKLTPTSECLGDEVLAGYVDGLLDETARTNAEQHMARCDYCLRQLVELAELAGEILEKPTSVVEYVIEVARKGVRLLSFPEAGFTIMEPEPVAVLGSEPTEKAEQLTCAWTQTFGAEKLTFTLTHVDSKHVNVSVSRAPESAPLEGWRLNLYYEDKLVQSEPLPQKGTVTLENLETATYRGEITTPAGDSFPFTLRLEATS